MAGTMERLWRHWRTTAARTRRMFPPATLAAVGAAITAGEQRHRGELRLIVETRLPSAAIRAGISNRQRAIALFAEYGVWDTEDNCGVLVYVNVAEQKVDIVVDRNIGRRIAAATWQQVCAAMTAGFARAEFHDSTLAAIAQVNALLAEQFPASGARANELPDAPLVL
ncbi:MAG: TPM domain-containing protein [Pseudomonadota bacterium]